MASRLPSCFHLPFLPFQLFLFVHSDPWFLCPVSCCSFSFCSLCIFSASSSYILFSLSHLSHSAQNGGLHCFFLILPNQSTVPVCCLNKGNPGHVDIACKSPYKLRYGKYSEQNKQQWQWGQSELASFFEFISDVLVAHHPEILSPWKTQNCILQVSQSGFCGKPSFMLSAPPVSIL